MSETPGERPIESSVRTDFRNTMDYAGYLNLEQILSAQHPLSDPAHHDELLFIIQHQTSELWLKLMLHELRGSREYLDADEPSRALKGLARVKQILRTLTEQWSVLATLTPSEYAEFRAVLGSSSGFQSAQYRSIEFILGNKNSGMLRMFEAKPEIHAELTAMLQAPTLYDSFLAMLSRRGYAVPQEVLERDVTAAWVEQPALVPMFTEIYESVDAHWDVYEVCESLVDIEDAFQLWRFRHMSTVQRTIGFKRGTGGSSGVGFLRHALELSFFPELISLRTEIRDLSD
ncbi:tryptophan 2,3-dioxygenase [Leucobacter luti]|uniref:tryptophan 2,3-dioxygenase n=1 Tax=Leucobacter luti TaxID=340320 RepID=UPI00104967AC|nr:tryptophan 2,3-dioxygenase family protein [Leucobacter luti]MCW2289767.1 tryptophan 2,3-dioxygenase [Leucobacter luti]TCK34303.1 tryptophan 2,3-dioxygenase [Leucobacter luti]